MFDRKLPIGVQDFEKLRLGNFLYIDKTRYLYELVNLNIPYFISRPRRFGKSLFLSTLREYFLGKKELFEGLTIAEYEKDWTPYPVIYIDMNKESYQDEQTLKDVLNEILSRYETEWGIKNIASRLPLRFDNLIQHAHKQTGRRVVVLVDEYDKPLLSTLDNETVNDAISEVLKGFYGILKSADAHLHFIFLTGVTKFPKVSVFSDLNNLTDISLDFEYAGICGISETELLKYFQPEIKNLSEKLNLSYEATLAELKKYFDGYHFCENTEGIYNPFSILKTFKSGKFRNYWYETGTPSFLVRMLKKNNFDIPCLENDIHISADDITTYKVELNNPIPILYQSGYLTIKNYDAEFNEFILGFPNEEVRIGFLKNLLPVYAYGKEFSAVEFIKTLRAGDIDGFMNNLRAFYASIPYDLIKNEYKDEHYYQFIFYLIVTLMGQFIQTEVKSAAGRADAVIKTSDTIFVFEFKMANNGTAEDALVQIDSKNYLIPFTSDGRKLVKIGAEFNETERGISRWKKG